MSLRRNPKFTLGMSALGLLVTLLTFSYRTDEQDVKSSVLNIVEYLQEHKFIN